MLNIWLPVFCALAALDWLALYYGWRRVNYLSKPAAMLALLLWFGIAGQFRGILLWFGIGFLFSLLGDILLLLSHRYFTTGLAAFLLAHLAYIAAFNHPLPDISIHVFVLALTLAALGVFVFSLLRQSLESSSLHAKMVLPVGLYSAVLTIMLFSALLTLFRADWDPLPAVFAACGGLLFYCSDTLLGFDRFARPLKHARLWVRITYHLGQLGLGAGALLAVVG